MSQPRRSRAALAAIGVFVGLTLLGTPPGAAIPDPLAVTSLHTYWTTSVLPVPWNGYKVFLSSPRHTDSGSRGECRSPGYEENVNGRRTNLYAADGDYYNGVSSPEGAGTNLLHRGYLAWVSANSRDGGYLANRTKSRDWGSNLHVVTHTNAASGGCGSSTQYLLVMWNSATDKSLALALGNSLDAVVPGPFQNWSDDVAELLTNAPNGDAYVELAFHPNQSAQSWIVNSSRQTAAWRYGAAIDSYLNYP